MKRPKRSLTDELDEQILRMAHARRLDEAEGAWPPDRVHQAVEEVRVMLRAPDDTPLALVEAEARGLRAYLRSPWPEPDDPGTSEELWARAQAQRRRLEVRRELTERYQAIATLRGRSHPAFAGRDVKVQAAVGAAMSRLLGAERDAQRWAWWELIEAVDRVLPAGERFTLVGLLGIELGAWSRWCSRTTCPPPERLVSWAEQIGEAVRGMVAAERARRRRRRRAP